MTLRSRQVHANNSLTQNSSIIVLTIIKKKTYGLSENGAGRDYPSVLLRTA